jgi:hypothetical protein
MRVGSWFIDGNIKQSRRSANKKELPYSEP